MRTCRCCCCCCCERGAGLQAGRNPLAGFVLRRAGVHLVQHEAHERLLADVTCGEQEFELGLRQPALERVKRNGHEGAVAVLHERELEAALRRPLPGYADGRRVAEPAEDQAGARTDAGLQRSDVVAVLVAEAVHVFAIRARSGFRSRSCPAMA